MEEHYAQAAAAEQDAADGEAIDAIRMRAAHEQRAADVEATAAIRLRRRAEKLKLMTRVAHDVASQVAAAAHEPRGGGQEMGASAAEGERGSGLASGRGLRLPRQRALYLPPEVASMPDPLGVSCHDRIMNPVAPNLCTDDMLDMGKTAGLCARCTQRRQR